jgi:hypothetical protein
MFCLVISPSNFNKYKNRNEKSIFFSIKQREKFFFESSDFLKPKKLFERSVKCKSKIFLRK